MVHEQAPLDSYADDLRRRQPVEVPGRRALRPGCRQLPLELAKPAPAPQVQEPIRIAQRLEPTNDTRQPDERNLLVQRGVARGGGVSEAASRLPEEVHAAESLRACSRASTIATNAALRNQRFREQLDQCESALRPRRPRQKPHHQLAAPSMILTSPQSRDIRQGSTSSARASMSDIGKLQQCAAPRTWPRAAARGLSPTHCDCCWYHDILPLILSGSRLSRRCCRSRPGRNRLLPNRRQPETGQPAHSLRIPAKADTCSNPKRTPIPIDIGQLSERSDALGLVINKCPI